MEANSETLYAVVGRGMEVLRTMQLDLAKGKSQC